MFVCLGNICRSPTAHGVFRHLVTEAGLERVIRIDSAGTHAYHVGEAPDRRSLRAAKNRGIDFGDLRARQVHWDDFHQFDYILAMDQENYAGLSAVCPPEMRHKVEMFLRYGPDTPVGEVPDPYYGGPNGFERVLDLVEGAARGLLSDIRARHTI